MALSYASAYWIIVVELKRKERNGLLKPISQKKINNAPVTIIDFITATVIAGFIGFKGLEMILDYDSLVQNPQAFLLSGKGSWFGAIALGAYAYYNKRKEADALKGKVKETVMITVLPHELMGDIVAIGAIAGLLGVNPFFLEDYLTASRNYSIGKLVEIIALLREYDLKGKGLGSQNIEAGELYKEMIFKILH